MQKALESCDCEANTWNSCKDENMELHALVSIKVHGVKSHKTFILILTAMPISNLTRILRTEGIQIHQNKVT